MKTKRNPIFCAIDTADLAEAVKLATQLRGHVYGLKLGLEFFMAHGAVGYKAISEVGMPIFLDVKLHDIPNTVAGALKSLILLRPDFITIHASGGEAMLQAARQVVQSDVLKTGHKQTQLLGVTVLTSLSMKDLAAVGQGASTIQQVTRLAKLSHTNKLNGIVCSPDELKSIRPSFGPDFVFMVPGIRPEGSATQDQKRVMTPREAMDAGATFLVIGRPITSDPNPAAAALRIVNTL